MAGMLNRALAVRQYHYTKVRQKMTNEPKALTIVIASVLFFLSGSAALVYEVLWMKELSLLFGNSAQAAAATLAAFFTGIAAGNAYWGRRASKLARPLMTYGVLELCVTLSAVLYFAVYYVYDGLYPSIFSVFEQAPTAFALAKFALALLMFFPAAFFMGGTLPVMTQYLVRNHETLGKRASVLYAINTLGAASGAIVAGFYLPQAIGLDASYFLAMAVTLFVGVLAVLLGRKDAFNDTESSKGEGLGQSTETNEASVRYSLTILAWVSGFASLALQVLWIRMFAQVLHNSVYTYSAILAVFLLSLAIGGTIARELARRHIVAHWFLPVLLSLTALLIAASPMLFYSMTDGASYIVGDEGFAGYLFQIFFLVIVVIGPPTVAMGVLLPYLFKLSEGGLRGPGETVGRLVTVNTVGAILGSVAAGFILLDWIGLWSSLKAISILYIVAALCLLFVRSSQGVAAKLAPIAVLIVLFTVLDTSKLPVVRIDVENKNETLLKVWEGADATVAVVTRDGHLRTKLNNWYTLGGTGDAVTEQMQTHLPMLLHPNPKHVFYLGLGSGITAGAVLDYKVEEVVVTEIAPSVIRASKEFFGEHTNGLFDDPRVKVIAEDGRNVLRGSKNTYDLIISDLFIPWKAGTGNLYSVEHYQTAAKRLNDDGMYTQWLPFYQLTKDEFAIIARSMQAVFPTVSLWRGNFHGDKPAFALIGHKQESRLSPTLPLVYASRVALQRNLSGQGDQVPLIAHYAGTLRTDDKRINTAELNTDSHPVIEYLAPINHRLEKAGKAKWLVGQEMLEFIGPYANQGALLLDPYLANINPAWYDAIQSGYYLQGSFVLKDQKQNDKSAKARYQSLLKKAATALK